MDRGAGFQKTVFSESRCTDHILQSLTLTGRLRGIVVIGAKNVNGFCGAVAELVERRDSGSKNASL